MSALASQSCKPCNAGDGKLAGAEIRKLLAELPEWELSSDGGTLTRYIEYKSYRQALEALVKISAIAEKEQHHPDLGIGWGYLDISLTTHAVDGLTKNDFISAAKYDEVV
jgi:4a-hydroxytetrahydrobiopterin dehydratase